MSDRSAKLASAIIADAMRGFPTSRGAKSRAAKLLAKHFGEIDLAGLQDRERVAQLVHDYMEKRERAKASPRHIGEELMVFAEVLGVLALSRPDYEQLATRALRNWRNATVNAVIMRTKVAGSA
jgi:hypothetical protein